MSGFVTVIYPASANLLASETGMRVLAIRRADNSEWLLSPNSGTGLEEGDVLVAKGTRLGAERIVALVS